MRFSLYPRAVLWNDDDRKGKVVSADTVVEQIRTGSQGLAQRTNTLRQYLSKGQTEKYRVEKSKILPAATFSGTFSIRSADVELADKFTEHSGILTFDIDGIPTESIRAMKSVLSLHPNIFLIFNSPSGTGLKAFERVDPIPTTKDDSEHKYIWSLCKAKIDAKLSVYGYKCDSGDDLARLCFFAYDPDIYYEPSKEIGTWDRDTYHQELQEKERNRKHQQKERRSLETRNWDKTEIDISALEFIPNNLPYAEWRNVGMAIKDAGLPMSVFESWCGGQRLRSTGEWITEDINGHWNRWNRTAGKIATWGTIVYLAKQQGYELPHRRRGARLNRTNTPPKKVETPNPDFSSQHRPSPINESLERNRVERERVSDTYFTAETDDSLHILLIKESTGSGKSHTIFAKSNQHSKRTIINPPHNELASQAIDLAYKQGYTNPIHLLGREHNWEQSGIAGIPVKMRTADLFEKNNCIMVDEVKRYTDKRLAPRTYCEHRCDFRDECAHLAQYKGLGQRDFIANSTPNLLFDLNMRGYLVSLVTATDETTDEDLAIDVILGTESKETQDFDFAILDDYGISGLYTDVSLSQSEFKALKKAWCGTPTGAFAKSILKACEKKKPQKILKALRKALESSAEHHDEITENLTKHVRLGTIQELPRPKGSKESQRMLTDREIKYADGAKHFIPVDAAAYKELTEKGFTCINPEDLDSTEIDTQVQIPMAPVTALMSGVKVQDLTPVWQKGATPIDLIRIFLDSIGNDKNAPISRSFRVGDPPVAILTFSIPPQAPVGILPQIAMLSATSNIDDTRQAFHKQPVKFSEYTGGTLDWAENVEVYQYQDARLTSGSIFEYPKDDDGKRRLQENPVGLTKTATVRITKLNEWARAIEDKTAFISYKEFTEQFREKVDGFDIVTHFDTVAGLNFDGLKFLVVFGYPKVKHKIVMEQARRQFASDAYPLPKGTYEQLTETAEWQDEGITITENRYLDTRLEKIRHQLSTEKLEQAIGRSRLPRWKDTTTLVFTDAPVSSITHRATFFSETAFTLADAPSGLANAMQQIADAEASGDVKAVMETTGVSRRTANRKTKQAREHNTLDRDTRILQLCGEGKSTREIESIMKGEGYEKVSRPTINRVIQGVSKGS